MALSKFEKEFKAARDRGEKEFEFGGKKFTTKYKEEGSAPAKKMKPKASQEFPMTPAPEYKDSSISGKSSLGDIALKASRQAEANRAAMEANRPPPVPRKKSMLEEAREEATRRAAAAQNYEDSRNVSTTPARRFDGKGPGLGALSGMKSGGKVKIASGGSASKRADGIAQKGKTRGKMC
jgi:hypothetical protein